jgi:xylulokinase
VTLEAPLSGQAMATSGLCCGCHTVRDRYYLLGGLMGGGVLAWVSRLLAGGDTPQALNGLMEAAAGSPPGANGVQFLPYLDGSGPPDCDPAPWGAWLGLSLKHTRSDVIRSAVEGLSFGIRSLLEVALTWTNISVSELRCVGGGSRNAFWQQVKADVLGVPVDTPLVSDVTAQGAALLAAVGAHCFRDEVEASRVAYRSGVRYEINSERSRFYDDAYRHAFQKIHRVNKPNQTQEKTP